MRDQKQRFFGFSSSFAFSSASFRRLSPGSAYVSGGTPGAAAVGRPSSEAVTGFGPSFPNQPAPNSRALHA